MKKPISVLLAFVMVICTISCLFSMPVSASDDVPVNIIYNGDFNEGVYSEATGNADKNTPLGWYDLSAQYANAKIIYPHNSDIASGSFTNFSTSKVMGINSWQRAVQKIVLEAGKTYKVSAKMTMNAGTASQTGDRYLAIGLDVGDGMDAASLDTKSAWYARKTLEFMTTTKSDGTTEQGWTGDFTEHSFIFNSDDFIVANNITADADGKFDARFVFYNACTGWGLIDDVTIYEVTPISATVANQNGIYGGYITGDNAGVIGQKVTLVANPYYGNTFEGWYNGETRVSDEPVYEATVTADLVLVAKFNIENLWADSGFENLGANTNLLWNDGATADVGLWYSEKSSTNWHAVVSNERVAAGNYALKLTHRNNPVSTSITVEANKDYTLSFDWVNKGMYMTSDSENPVPTYLDKVAIRDAYGITIAEYALHTDNTGEFQNTEVYFNSGDNEKLFVTVTYYAGSGCIYLDNFALYEGKAGDNFVKVTYDSDNATVGSFYEWVKTGTEYTVRSPEFQTPVAKKLLGYTYSEQTFDFSDDVADVIVVGTEDIVLKAYYKNYVSDKLSSKTTFNPEDYDYTFVVLPDEQNVNSRYPHYYSSITQWIVDNKDLYNIKGAISVGDITQSAALGEWARAYEAYMLLEEAGIPFALTPGNHDYEFGVSHGTPSEITVRRTEYLNLFFNRDTVDYSKYTTCPVTGDSLINSYYTVEAGTQKYLVMALEIFPRHEVLAWASDVLNSHPDHKAIVATHSHLFSNGSYADDYDDYSINYPEDSNSAEDVVEKFITKHENLLMYICGHAHSDLVRNVPVVGDNGNVVYQILADHQNDDKNELGIGNVVIIGINEAEGKLGFTTYSTLQGKYYLPDKNEFTVQYGKSTPATPAAPTLADKTETSVTLNAVDGCEYSMDGVTWQASPEFTGLTAGTEYTFYQRVAETDFNYASAMSDALIVATEESALNGWIAEGDKWMYYLDGEKLVNEFVTISGKNYFFDVDGYMTASKWVEDVNGWIYYGASGAQLFNGWCRDSIGWCYVGEDGYAVTNQWKKDNTGWCYLNSNGSMTKNKWVKDGGKWYYLDANGYMVTNKWMKDSKGWCYLGSSGAMATNAWVRDSIGWCYVGADGYAVTNCWKKDSTGWCYLNSNGSMVKNNWVQDGGKWYYLDQNGYMVYSTSRKIGTKTYNFNASGVCTNP